MNRRVRDPYARWCERCTGGLLVRQPPNRLAVVIFLSRLIVFFYNEHTNFYLPSLTIHDKSVFSHQFSNLMK